MKFYGAGYGPLGYLNGSEAHRRNVAHRVSKSARQVAKLQDKAFATMLEHYHMNAEQGYPIGTVVDYHGSIMECHGAFTVIARQYDEGDEWTPAGYRYVIKEVGSVLRLHSVRHESISVHVE